RHYNSGCLGAIAFKQLHYLANRRPGGDDIINDQYPALQWGAYRGAAFAMALGLLAIEAVRLVDLMPLCQCGCGYGDQRNALVRGPEQQIVIQAGMMDCCSITATEEAQRFTGIEQAGVKKIGTRTPGFK